MKRFIPYILTALFFFSCKDEYTICDLPTAVRMKCVFYHVAGGLSTETAVPFLTVTKITSPNPDYAAAMLSDFSLALNPVADSVQYRISVRESSVPDTVTFVYTTQNVNISATCGDVYINNLTKVRTTVNSLDSVKISGNAVNTTSGENVRIYF